MKTKRFLCLFAAISMLLTAPAVYAAVAADDDQARVISGRVIEVDPVGATVVVAYQDSMNALVNTTFFVPNGASLVGGDEALDLDDVQVSDRVEIEYTGDLLNRPVVKHLVDMDRTNW